MKINILTFLQAAVSMLKQEYNEDNMPLSDALKLAIKVLNKTLDVTKLTKEKGAVNYNYKFQSIQTFPGG